MVVIIFRRKIGKKIFIFSSCLLSLAVTTIFDINNNTSHPAQLSSDNIVDVDDMSPYFISIHLIIAIYQQWLGNI